MNVNEKCNKVFAKNKTLIMLLLMIMSFNQMEAQITLSSVADAAYDKKVQKSPAKDVIIKSDRAISKVYDQHSSFNDAKKLFGYDQDRFVRSYNAYDSLEYYKNEIKRLDPKWKVKAIETCQTTYAAKHNEFSVFYLPFREGEKKCVEYEAYFSKVYNIINPLVGKGEELYKFVSGQDTNKFNLLEYRKMEKEAVELLNTHEYFDKQVNKWFTPKITGLSYLKIRDNDASYDYYTFLGREFDRYKWLNEKSKSQEALQDSDFPEALKNINRYENSYYNAKALVILFPENARVKEIYNFTETNFKKFDAYKEKIAISPFHKANMGKTFFSNHKITFGKETAADFKTEFKAGEPIFMIYYGSDPFYLKNERTYNLFVKVGDEWKNCDKYHAFSYSDGVTGDGKTLIYQYCLAPTQDLKLPSKEYAQADRQLACLSELKPGQHVIKIEDYSGDATFTLTIDEANNYKKDYDYAHNVYFNSIPLPKEGMSDASVHSWVVKAFANSDSKDLDGVQHLRTYIVSKEWNYFTNKYTGQINERRAEIVLVCKDKKGDCFIFYADYSQDKAGSIWTSPSVSFRSGSYVGEDFYRGDENSRVYLNCSKL